MRDETIRALNDLNRAFYRQNARSFSATRQAPWNGWRTLSRLASPRISAEGPVRVLDVACGNLRFEQFLMSEFEDVTFDFAACDMCPELAGKTRVPCSYEQRDIVEELLCANDARGLFGPAQRDIAVAFGFMHHIPGFRLRALFLDALLSAVRTGGIASVSLWRFLKDPTLADKAARMREAALAQVALLGIDEHELESHDAFLGWQNDTRSLRYCHSFSDDEIDALVQSVAQTAKCTARFAADGKSGKLNTYLVFERF